MMSDFELRLTLKRPSHGMRADGDVLDRAIASGETIPHWYGRRASEHALPLTDLGCRVLGIHLATTTIREGQAWSTI